MFLLSYLQIALTYILLKLSQIKYVCLTNF